MKDHAMNPSPSSSGFKASSGFISLWVVLIFIWIASNSSFAIESVTVGVVIAGLAIWLLVRWRRGLFHLHLHAHEAGLHAHGHVHDGSDHPHRSPRARSPLQAFGIGLVHGMGGSAGVGVLLLASIHDRWIAVAALALFALCTALSMAALSTGLGFTLTRGRVAGLFPRIAPALGLLSLSFGVWYALGALDVAPYYF